MPAWTFMQKKKRKSGKLLIDDFDILIGATAIEHGLTMVTNNTGI